MLNASRTNSTHAAPVRKKKFHFRAFCQVYKKFEEQKTCRLHDEMAKQPKASLTGRLGQSAVNRELLPVQRRNAWYIFFFARSLRLEKKAGKKICTATSHNANA